ncbi:augmin complex subunit msd5 [Drosophila subpulchrella]|uniref:augmin complex subunit msd5 n=1 Tax=Drosophila subpulchrella TaxID=1486046 RepID=UPI0018A15027|nr:augmin complex subunit msd5 [Drosophila subpulchrella]
MENNVDFSRISSKLYQKYAQHVKNLKDVCVSKTVMKPGAFFDNLKQMMEEEAAVTTPAKDMGSVADYAELFTTLEEYPANLQRMPKKRELQRTNSTFLRGAGAAEDSVAMAMNTSNVSLSLTRLEEQRSSVDVYNDFKAFQRKLAKIYDEAAALDTTDSIYKQKLSQLHGFAQQLEKLMPTGGESPPDAFTSEEQETLLAIAANMEQLNYLRSNSLQLPNPNEILANGSVAARLEMFVEVLTYTLLQISSYNMALI